MSLSQATQEEPSSEYRYHLLRAATERFQSGLAGLDAAQLRQVEQQAQQTFALESLVLSTSEARDTLIPERRLDEAVAEIRDRYLDTADFTAELNANGLEETTLRNALRRELVFDAVMQRIGSRAEPVTETDERLFYELHHERFIAPERRGARQILITINEEYAENGREAARARIDQIAETLKKRPQDFGKLAQAHSECPTAMQQGQLGTLPRGQLYPELDATLFALEPGQISEVVESEIGLHLLLCETAEPATTVTFDQARTRIHAILAARQSKDCQKRWLAALQQQAPPRTEVSTA
ncbi:nitrogen fixation protein NifM [Thiorhodococcus mannitoliphagus]|uniref:peptidylprolyl isomerase n=1 Tax=Thiorhodococcus mannitoliphagus TaxID=329406 RepID=A0A6P1DV07_9GAMM|nr:nitrogen fixation protein NifM [Thiorhodococcus mannitoliphagus]NEX19534.1 nitrogen fixation protein NifM [Thiorhodococcus mannitoliphagus]